MLPNRLVAQNCRNMDSRGLKQRFPAALAADPRAGDELKTSEPQLAKNAEHGTVMAAVRLLLFITWFNCVCCTTHLTQILGSPLYFINKDYYYAYMALTKQSFGLLITTVTQWFSPTMVRVSGDKSVRGQLTLTKDGRLETRFPERLVMITNHQLYVDWLYFWWISYCNSMHGHIFIILKESLKYIPVIGPGMMFFGFVFMARSWATDKSRLHHGLQNLKARHNGPLSGSQTLDPMWLLMFPEGTNLSKNNRKKSAAWAEKQGIKDLRHQLLPRSTGLQYCLEELGDSVDWVYDCTTAYEGIPCVKTLRVGASLLTRLSVLVNMDRTISRCGRHTFRVGLRNP
jgi:1-acyl-sn-glycerol-3-phosphate acyltransferase